MLGVAASSRHPLLFPRPDSLEVVEFSSRDAWAMALRCPRLFCRSIEERPKAESFWCLRESSQQFSRSLPYRISPWHQAWREGSVLILACNVEAEQRAVQCAIEGFQDLFPPTPPLSLSLLFLLLSTRMSGFSKLTLVLLSSLILLVLCLILKLVYWLWRRPRSPQRSSIDDGDAQISKEHILLCLFRRNQTRVEPNPQEAKATPPSKMSTAEERTTAADDEDAFEKYQAMCRYSSRMLYTIEEEEEEEEEEQEEGGTGTTRLSSDGEGTQFFTPAASLSPSREVLEIADD
ncbi:hypothetical protein MUK42_17449 [Musa troglodytarum]|uniref:Uncharacterized protein n=1 Tax=Musa troglodytarum TaxID=320322 RepID=A0A9E7I243_9LILI|nr:hypothetical protein MUK42_17449 [Musa troglodytarum]